MDKKEFIAFNNRFNRFILAFDQLKKNQHKSGVDKSITLNEVHFDCCDWEKSALKSSKII